MHQSPDPYPCGIVICPTPGEAVLPFLTMLRCGREPRPESLNDEARAMIEAGRAIPAFFERSESDLTPTGVRMSVYSEPHTTPEQACALITSGKWNWAARLHVGHVCLICAPPTDTHGGTLFLRVEWEPARVRDPDGTETPDTRPGAEGHAALLNTDKGNKTQNKLIRKALAEASVAWRVVNPLVTGE